MSLRPVIRSKGANWRIYGCEKTRKLSGLEIYSYLNEGVVTAITRDAAVPD